MATLQQSSKEIIESLQEATEKKTSGYDTTAEVIRIDDGTAWVHIPGGVDETPVKLTINASVGDIVHVRVSGGRAWITGNASAPPTDDTTAIHARHIATNAEETAIEAEETAEAVEGVANSAYGQATQALQIAGDTNQYFWFQSTGVDTGAHITEVPQDAFTDPTDPDYHTGGNLLARSNGIAVRDGMDELATFGTNGEAFYNDVGVSMFEVGKETAPNNFSIKEFCPYDNSSPFSMTVHWSDHAPSTVSSYTFYRADGTYFFYSGSSSDISVSGRTVTFNATVCMTLQNNSVKKIAARYSPTYKVPVFTSGTRSEDVSKGPFSFSCGLSDSASGAFASAFGHGNSASGDSSFAIGRGCGATDDSAVAEGIGCVASEYASHAQNLGTIAGGDASTAIGKYNDTIDNTIALVIGNGTGTDGVAQTRSNALTVDWNGKVEANEYYSEKDDGQAFQHVTTDGNTGMYVERTDTSVSAHFGIGSGGNNHGIYTNKHSRWMIYDDASGITKIPGANSQMHGHTIGTMETFVVSSHTTTNTTVNGGSTMSAATQTFTKSGYYPLAIAGWVLNGSNATNLTLVQLYISSQSNGSVDITYRIHNAGSSNSTSTNVRVYILWIKA